MARTITILPSPASRALARALRVAVAIDPRAKDEVPSTKGSLGG